MSAVIPPLDHPPQAARRKKGLVGALVGAGLGASIMGLVMLGVGDVRWPDATLINKISGAALVLLAVALAPLCHELGHVLGGWLAGFRFVWLVWGPVQILRSGGRVQVWWNRSLARAGGMALCVPREAKAAPLLRTLLFVGAGPVASLSAGAASLALAAWAGMPGHLSQGGLAAAAFGIASLGIGLVTLVPLRLGEALSDGARIIRAMRSSDAAIRDLALAALAGLAFGPDRPRDWPPELVSTLAGAGDDVTGVSVRYMLYLHALDTGDVARARNHLQWALTHALPSEVNTALSLEAAYFEVAVRRDPQRCREWLGRITRTPDPSFRRVIEQAADFLSGVPDAGAKAVADCERLAERSGPDAARAEWLVRCVTSRAAHES